MSDIDAKALAQHLHAAAASPEVEFAVTDTIARIERTVEADGLAIPDGMRMRFEHFRDEFSPLLLFLYEGAFVIDGDPSAASLPSPSSSPSPSTTPLGAGPVLTTRTDDLMPYLRPPRWPGWTGAAHRPLAGTSNIAGVPRVELATIEGGEPRLLSDDTLRALGDRAALEIHAIANLERLPFELEVVETTKGVLGIGKKPLCVACRGPWAAERVLSPRFVESARAALGNPISLAVAIPTRELILVRTHDAPHFGSAHDVLGRRVLEPHERVAKRAAIGPQRQHGGV